MSKQTDYVGKFLKPDRKLHRLGKPETFGDFVRRQLENPVSPLSQRVKFFRGHMQKVKNNPKKYGFEWFIRLPIYKKYYSSYYTPNPYYFELGYPFDEKTEIADFRP